MTNTTPKLSQNPPKIVKHVIQRPSKKAPQKQTPQASPNHPNTVPKKYTFDRFGALKSTPGSPNSHLASPGRFAGGFAGSLQAGLQGHCRGVCRVISGSLQGHLWATTWSLNRKNGESDALYFILSDHTEFRRSSRNPQGKLSERKKWRECRPVFHTSRPHRI